MRLPGALVLGLSLIAGRVAAQTPVAQADSAGRPLSLLDALKVAEGESETVGLAHADVARARGERRRARSGYFPQLSGAATLSAYAPKPVFRARNRRRRGHDERGARARVRPIRAAAESHGRAAARFAGKRSRVRQRLRPLLQLPRPSLRPREHLPLRPLVFADALQRRAGEWPVPFGRRRSEKRRAGRVGGESAIDTRRHAVLLRRGARQSSPADRRSHARPGRLDPAPDRARPRGGQPVGVRPAPGARYPRQPASGGHSAARRP